MKGTMSEQGKTSSGISDLPVDELLVYGRELGLGLNERRTEIL